MVTRAVTVLPTHFVEQWEIPATYNLREINERIDRGELRAELRKGGSRPVKRSRIDHPPGTIMDLYNIFDAAGARVAVAGHFRLPDGTLLYSKRLDPTRLEMDGVIYQKRGEDMKPSEPWCR